MIRYGVMYYKQAQNADADDNGGSRVQLRRARDNESSHEGENHPQMMVLCVSATEVFMLPTLAFGTIYQRRAELLTLAYL